MTRSVDRQIPPDLFAEQLVDLPSNRHASPAPDGTCIAYVSDRSGESRVWVAEVDPASRMSPRMLTSLSDPAVDVRWSPDGRWLAVSVAAGGGVPTSVWVVRPDDTDARLVADAATCGNALLGPWTRRSAELVVTLPARSTSDVQRSVLIDPATGATRPLAEGELAQVLDVSDDERFLLVRDGPRGQRWCVVVDRDFDVDHPVQPFASAFFDAFPVTGVGHYRGAVPGGGSTDAGVLRRRPDQRGVVAYVRSDVGRQHAALLAVPLSVAGVRGEAGLIASRSDADLELFAADRSGSRLALVWNAGGYSQLELLDTATFETLRVDSLDGSVITSVAFAGDAPTLAVTAETADNPARTWIVDTVTGAARTLVRREPVGEGVPVGYGAALVSPRPIFFDGFDGLPLSGWLYEPLGRAQARAVLVYLHGGPEAEERPTYSPLFQTLVAADIAVFAPNVRGSTGSGRTFGHADDRGGRYAGLTDIAAATEEMLRLRVARPGAVLVGGRSYGGYATLAAMTRFPDLFAGGIAECGMSDLPTFFATTEPWIAAAASSKYGDPRIDRALLEDLSPLKDVGSLAAPVLLVHGALDTNVPYSESTQFLAAARAIGLGPGEVDLITIEGEGHDFKSRAARLQVVHAWLRFCTHLVGSAVSEGVDQRVDAG